MINVLFCRFVIFFVIFFLWIEGPVCFSQETPDVLTSLTPPYSSLNDSKLPDSVGAVRDKPVLGLRYFLLTKFIGKWVPILDGSGSPIATGMVVDVQKKDRDIVFFLKPSPESSVMPALAIFTKDALGESYRRYTPNTNALTQQNIDMEQRLSAGIGPLLDRAPTEYSSSTPVMTPKSVVPEVGAGETVVYRDPQTGTTTPALAVVYKGLVYLKNEGFPLTLHLEKQP